MRTILSRCAALGWIGILPGALGAADLPGTIIKGAIWLASKQNPDGGYGPFGEGQGVRVKNASDVGITAFAVYALARCSAGAKAPDPAAALAPGARAVDYLLSKQQPDGAFYDPRDPTLQIYKTCVALLALNTLDRARFAAQIRKAQAFIQAQQFTEDDGYKPDANLGYGGIGYGGKQAPDLSNTQYGLEALAESGLSGSDELWKKAAVFIGRCQNGATVDPLVKGLNIGTTGDGGFRYRPDDTRGAAAQDGGPKLISSYGSMTYAALKSLLYANVSKKDRMVQEAFAWISKTFTVRENPGMATQQNPKAGLQGLYYYYHTMAKALSLYGEPRIRDAAGVEHDWAKELSMHIAALQSQEGSWKNTSDRWFEEIPVLATPFALVALVDCRTFRARAPAAAPESAGK